MVIGNDGADRRRVRQGTEFAPGLNPARSMIGDWREP